MIPGSGVVVDLLNDDEFIPNRRSDLRPVCGVPGGANQPGIKGRRDDLREVVPALLLAAVDVGALLMVGQPRTGATL